MGGRNRSILFIEESYRKSESEVFFVGKDIDDFIFGDAVPLPSDR